jgi:Zn-dependent protease/CBS domain-containing protein
MQARNPPPKQAATRGRGLRVGSLIGIDIHLDASLIIIFVLVVWMLGGNVFPAWHQEWSAVQNWTTGLAAGILFFISLLLHELAHAVVARKYGISVPRITLFLFGGMAEIEDEPDTPKTEFFIAIAGPLTSLFLGLFFSLLAGYMAGSEFAQMLVADQQAAMAMLAPLPTLLFWLGPINIMLALFNMVPGFPLDGGRVLRAAWWWMTGDLDRATRLASDAGRLFGWFLMGMGFFRALSGAFVQGLWMILIGWFLTSAASTSYAQMKTQRTLKGRLVRDLMRRHFETAGADLPVSDFVNDHLLQSPQVLWPVLADGRLVGFVTLEEVKRLSPEERESLRVGDILQTDLTGISVHPEMDAAKAIQLLSASSTPLAVVRDDEIVGLLSQADAVKWLALHDDQKHI